MTKHSAEEEHRLQRKLEGPVTPTPLLGTLTSQRATDVSGCRAVRWPDSRALLTKYNMDQVNSEIFSQRFVCEPQKDKEKKRNKRSGGLLWDHSSRVNRQASAGRSELPRAHAKSTSGNTRPPFARPLFHIPTAYAA